MNLVNFYPAAGAAQAAWGSKRNLLQGSTNGLPILKILWQTSRMP
jgi:hypothetical protein